MPYALIEGGMVRQVFDSPPSLHPAMEIVEISDDVQQGWTRSATGGFVPPELPQLSQADLKRHAAGTRMIMETSSISINGVDVPLTLGTQMRVLMAAARARDKGAKPLRLKDGDGKHITLTSEQSTTLPDQIATFLDDVLAKEQEVADQIDTGSITSPEQIEAEFRKVNRSF